MDVSIFKNNELVEAYSSIVKELKKETSFVQKMFLEIWQNTLQLNSTEIHPTYQICKRLLLEHKILMQLVVLAVDTV